MKLTNANNIMIGHLNINSIRNKFDCFKYIDIILLPDLLTHSLLANF